MYVNNLLSTHTIGGFVCIIILTIFFQSKKKFIKRNGLFVKYRPEKKCYRCNGFGITRCTLCKGKGIVLYERKYLRFDPCPKCLQKRYDVCSFFEV
nr:carbon catabolite repressor protein 4 [Cryptomonas curvata]